MLAAARKNFASSDTTPRADAGRQAMRRLPALQAWPPHGDVT